jgi:hypothetical protein
LQEELIVSSCWKIWLELELRLEYKGGFVGCQDYTEKTL